MSDSVIFNNWRAVSSYISRWRRSGDAVEIWDADTRYNDIRPFACPVQCNTAKVQTLYPLSSCPCFGFPFKTNVCQSHMADIHWFLMDGFLREASTEELCAGNYGLLAGVPAPERAPVSSASCGSCDAVALSHVYTFVSERNGRIVESAPSPAAFSTSANGMTPNATLSDMDLPPAGDWGITGKRIYRLIQAHAESNQIASDQSEFVLAGRTDSEATIYQDDVSESDTLEPLLTYHPVRFPAPGNLIGLTKLSDRIAVADNHRVYVSLPAEAMFTFDGVVEIEDTIKAINAIDDIILVLTDRHPYIINVSTSNGLAAGRTMLEVVINFSHFDTLSIFNNTVTFAGEYGLYIWNGRSITALSESYFTPVDWKHIAKKRLVGTAFEYGYLLWSEALGCSLLFDYPFDAWMNESKAKGTVMPITFVTDINSAAVSRNGHILYAKKEGVYEWDFRRDVCNYTVFDANKQAPCDWCETCDWKVKLYYNSRGKNSFRFVRIFFDERSGRPINLSYYPIEHGKRITDETDYDLEVISSHSIRLPWSQISYQEFIMELTGNVVMDAVVISSTNHGTSKMVYDRSTGEER